MALVALAALIWQTWRVPPVSDRPLVTQSTARLPAALERATRAPVAALELTLDSLPGRRERAWARAIAGAGTRVRWRRASGASDGTSRATVGVPIATAVEPLPDPAGQMRLVTVGTPGTALAVGDGAGSVDSSALSATGARSPRRDTRRSHRGACSRRAGDVGAARLARAPSRPGARQRRMGGEVHRRRTRRGGVARRCSLRGRAAGERATRGPGAARHRALRCRRRGGWKRRAVRRADRALRA